MNKVVWEGLLRGAATAVLLVSVSPAAASAATILVRAGDNLQTAINAAQPGDTILLDTGATFTGNFVLPVKTGATTIVIRSAGLDSLFPAPGIRISPTHAPSLAKIRSGNTMAAVRTAAGAHHWKLQLLEIQANQDGYGDIVQIGDGSSAQYHLSQVPYEIELDRVYLHGDPLMGQKRGIALNGRSVTIRNCHISDIRGVGMDTQAIGGWNGPGPFLIENNYLEAAGENLMLGGADPSIPNLVSDGVIIRNNHISRPMSWRDPVVARPSGLAVKPQGGGALPAGTYRYRVVAQRRVSGGVVAQSTASSEVSVTVGAGAAAVVTWTAASGVSDYIVYRTSPIGTSQNWTVTAASFLDTGAAGRAGGAPTAPGTTWTVKNILELKNARNVLIEQNVLENHWAGAQAGYAIVFTPRNQDGGCSWCVVEDVTFRHNVVRNTAGGINILGYDNLHPSRQTRRIRIAHNLFTNLTQTLGGSGWFLLIGNAPADVTVDHNTIDSDATTLMYVYGAPEGGIIPIPGFRFTNNAARHGDYGINGVDVGFGNGVIWAFFGDGVVAGNWLQGGPAARYPWQNYFDGTFDAAFVNRAAGDYSAAAAGPLAGRATDGSNIGADLAAMTPALTNASRGIVVRPPTAPANVRRITR